MRRFSLNRIVHFVIEITMVLALAAVPYTDSFAQKKAVLIDSLWIDGQASSSSAEPYLKIDFHIDDLFDQSVHDGMERGFTVSITYQIELWRSRNNWFDKLVARLNFNFKVGYSKINRRYYLLNENNGERLTTTSFEKIEQKCAVHRGVVLADTSRFESGKEYYVLIKGILEPFSIENLEEMQKWLSGEVKGLDIKHDPEESPQRLTGRFLTFLKNITGFGDQQYSGRSRSFSTTPLRTILFVSK